MNIFSLDLMNKDKLLRTLTLVRMNTLYLKRVGLSICSSLIHTYIPQSNNVLVSTLKKNMKFISITLTSLLL